MQIKLSEQLKELRRRDGRTQEELAAALGVTSQAVSRWECGTCYPDMELMPSIANYFGVSIDQLFGYENERSKKVDALAVKIHEMNCENNGVDVSMDACIALAREALVEFPGNEKLMLALASVLYNAGYVRYGEYHLIDGDGYNIYDTERHRGYAEWKEAIKLYEKLLPTLREGDERHRAVRELSQLYLNVGDSEKALALAELAPSVYGCREALRINACDGKMRAMATSKALLDILHICAELMVSTVITRELHMTPAEKAESIKGAISLFDHVCTDGDYGLHHGLVCRMNLLLSVYLWVDGRKDEAFAALDGALFHAKALRDMEPDRCYTSHLLREVSVGRGDFPVITAELSEDWPWWSVQEDSQVKVEMQADPRWADWVMRTKE